MDHKTWGVFPTTDKNGENNGFCVGPDWFDLVAHGIKNIVDANLIASAPTMRAALLELACLGNGDRYGNSIGNDIAIRALGLNPGEIYNTKPQG